MQTLKTPAKQLTHNTDFHHFTMLPGHSLVATPQTIHNNLQQSTVTGQSHNNIVQQSHNSVVQQSHSNVAQQYQSLTNTPSRLGPGVYSEKSLNDAVTEQV